MTLTLREEIHQTIDRLAKLLHQRHGDSLPDDAQTHLERLRNTAIPGESTDPEYSTDDPESTAIGGLHPDTGPATPPVAD